MDAIAQIASLANHISDDQYSPPREQQHDGSSGGKRKAEDGGHQPQQRAKRNRYISIACNEVIQYQIIASNRRTDGDEYSASAVRSSATAKRPVSAAAT
jgi:hypothetical protein